MKLVLFIITLWLGLLSKTLAQSTPPPTPAMRLTSSAFPDGGIIPDKFTQAAPGVAPGFGTSPALNWTNVPPGTKSFVLHMHDVDVARNKSTEDVLHWLVWNMPATLTSLPEGVPAGLQLPDGSYQMNISGTAYRGPGAPASGPLHHYVFELYALDAVPDVKPGADGPSTRTALLSAIQGHILGKAVTVGLFRRPQP